MSEVKQKDKRSGITYIYESLSFWNPVKKQSRAKRTLVGRLDESTGEILPTDGRGKRRGIMKLPPDSPRKGYHGAVWLLNKIGERTGVAEDLRKCFPDTYRQIMSLAYYMVLEEGASLARFGKWGKLHPWHPFGDDIPSQRASELFASISEKNKEEFFRLQGKRRVLREYWVYDTTSISSYSEMALAKMGKNKESDDIPQINLALIFGEDSRLPFWYRKLPGNMPDSKTVKYLIQTVSWLDMRHVKFVIDRGFHSFANLDRFYGAHIKFLVGVKTSLVTIRACINSIRDCIRTPGNFDLEHDVYGKTVRTEYTMVDGVKKRMYVHIYYNIDKAADDEMSLDKGIARAIAEVESGDGDGGKYRKYIEVRNTPKRGIRAKVREQAIIDAKRYMGFFVLVGNEKREYKEVLTIYRIKDVVEKAFGNIKERLNMRRTLVSTEEALEGKLFVAFVALIYLSYIKKAMHDAKLFHNYTITQALDSLDLIEGAAYGNGCRLLEILDKQKELYIAFGFTPE
jgi:hypothetical protein